MYSRTVITIVVATIFLLVATTYANTIESDYNNNKPLGDCSKLKCLSDAESLDIATRWLRLFDTGAVKSISDLTDILSPNITSYDETFSGPYSNAPGTTGIQEFFDSVTTPDPNPTTTNVTQVPLFVIHSCDQIAYRWRYTGFSTGFNSTKPPGTFLEFKGNDILHIDLKTRLIFNATSSGDWINLYRELGQISI